MAKKVLKFGGTSVGTIERIQHVANIIRQEKDKGHQIIAIVSAMAGKTNELINLSKKLSEDFNKRELITFVNNFNLLLQGDVSISKTDLIKNVKNIVKNLNHVETGENLDSRM